MQKSNYFMTEAPKLILNATELFHFNSPPSLLSKFIERIAHDQIQEFLRKKQSSLQISIWFKKKLFY